MHSCELGDSKPEEVYDIETFDNTFWPGWANFDVVQPSNEENCSKSCLYDCNCVVAMIRKDKCFKKKMLLSNGNLNTNLTGKTLMKVPKFG